MREEMAQRAREQEQRAREQKQRAREQEQRAREQAQRAEEQVQRVEEQAQRAWEQAHHLVEMQTGKAEEQAYHLVEMQLVTALRGPAVEVLGHLPPPQHASYTSVAEALKRRFGHHHQAEVYRARLKKRTRERGETLSQLAQDVEALVRRSEEMIVVLARDFFVDALQDQHLQIYVKQAHPEDLQVALARALEFEAFLKGTSGLEPAAQNRRDLWGRKVKMKAVSRRVWPPPEYLPQG
ncbi:putative golgin subfamily A member 6-like protein 19 [Penaeus japonicus]|uniref:putative golgin subfamily A member 6-like protein 19 n=1 Tax=Penaeus japonicus TaxID=27405 RepID=UPI001C717AE6|nr:putative golgin subfamily A member 6-like protein 19 [Penaeus japonicus]